MEYEKFVKSKLASVKRAGFQVSDDDLNKALLPWQARIVKWAAKRGRAALFEECGLGKTIQQLEWARLVVAKTGLPVVLHCPVGVRQQTLREAAKFGIHRQVVVKVCDVAADVMPESIAIINYEKMHHFDDCEWGGVVLDESSILKNFTGKIKRQLIERYRETAYRLACTATPAPNDNMELGTHAEFLGVCQREDMLSRFFIHDSGDTSKWRLKKHGVKDFWEWVCQWAVCVSKPSDIGGDDEGFILPELDVHRHFVTPEETDAPDDLLFNTSGISATNIHEEKRLSCAARVKKAVELATSKDGQCIIWCDTNYESEALANALPEGVEIRGSDKDYEKEKALSGFSDGKIRYLITKPSIAGFGLNWQQCNHQVFAGLSYSFEAYYQAVRRCWRFGQDKPVRVDIVLAETESGIQSAIARKEADFELMQSGMAEAMQDGTKRQLQNLGRKSPYKPKVGMEIPSFLQGETV